MESIEIIRIDLSEFKETFFNTLFLFPDEKDKNIEDYFETNNKFGWNVCYAEITILKSNNSLFEYKLLSKNGIEQSHAIKVKTKELEYWRYEFLSRELGYSPDFFEPSLEIFIKFYYQEILKQDTLLCSELSLPTAFYEISDKQQIKTIRYALSVDNLYLKPLFYISVDNNGYLQSVSDWQSIDNKHVVYPTPDYPNNYLIQKFSNKQEGNLYKLENVNSIEFNTIIFKGFKEYEVKYFADLALEPDFIKYGFFVQELREIINEASLLLKFIPTVNYHLIKPCNMVCKHCFSDFDEVEMNQLEFENAKQVIEEISRIKSFRKLNFSGGEPTLFKGIELLVKCAKEKGLETSMVSNGFKLIKSPTLLDSFIGYLDLLVLSIDSLVEESNLNIGRHVNNNTLSIEDFVAIANKCLENGIKIKINTVVTKNNFNQILAFDIGRLNPIRWKIFRMLPIANQNEKANNIYPTDDEFNEFLKINKIIAENQNIKVVSEDNNEMTGSYIMISPDGKFFNNIEGFHKYSEPILEVGIEKALAQTPLLREVFYKREGEYSCNQKARTHNSC
jgi:radical S-adenosyl methionine domain-containing protein 2